MNKEIEQTLDYLHRDYYKISDINKTKIVKYLKDRNDIGRFYAMQYFNKLSGGWHGQMWGDKIEDVFKYWPPDVIYDRKLNVVYEYAAITNPIMF